MSSSTIITAIITAAAIAIVVIDSHELRMK